MGLHRRRGDRRPTARAHEDVARLEVDRSLRRGDGDLPVTGDGGFAREQFDTHVAEPFRIVVGVGDARLNALDPRPHSVEIDVRFGPSDAEPVCCADGLGDPCAGDQGL
jgi:hypothetical protein